MINEHVHLNADLRIHPPLRGWIVFIWTWLFTAVGGAIAASLSVLPWSMFGFYFVAPVGFVCGGVLGIPIGLGMAITIGRVGLPDTREALVRRMTRVGAWIGFGLGMGVAGSLLLPFLNFDDHRYIWLLAWWPVGLTGVAAISGRWLGEALAKRCRIVDPTA